MCLITRAKHAHKTEVPILVYKVFNEYCENYYTPYQSVLAKCGENLCAENLSKDAFKFGKNYIVGDEGVHSFEHIGDAIALALKLHGVVIQCIIPAGDYYWKSVDGREYASKTLMVGKAVHSYEETIIHK